MNPNQHNRIVTIALRFARRFKALTPVCVSGMLILLTACATDVVQHNNAGNELYAKGAYDESILEYRQAQLDNPDRTEPYYNAANAYYHLGQLDGSQAQAQQALKTANPDLAAQTWYNLGNVYFDSKEWQEAITAYQQALRITPGDLDAKHNLELALKNLDRQQQDQAQNQQLDQQDTGSENRDSSDSDQASPTPANQSDSPTEPPQETPAPTNATQRTETMTRDQALQLLRALVGDSSTLQEQLSKIHVPLPAEAQDW